ncbi:MAG TPA: peptidase S8, partial [Anaerolineae bacterium]|nr:peptidase S8 [Anaerolineae bacterium]
MKNLLTPLTVALAMLLLGSIALAQQPANTAAEAKIAPHLLNAFEKGGQSEFFIVLTDKANLSHAARYSSKAQKGRYVYNSLWQTAQRSQAPLKSWLDKQGIKYRSFYIINALLVKGNYALAQTLAKRDDVLRLEANPTIHNDLPSPLLRVAAPRSANAIEPNISYIHADEVWAMGFTGQGVVVGGQDTGYDWDHPALINQYRGWNGATANHDYNWHDSIHETGSSCGADSPVPCDDYGHGTHTMGTAVGSDGGSNQIGVAPGAKWIGCRNMNVGDGTPATYLECFEFFLAPYPVGGTPAQGDPSLAPDVTVNSWGCPPSEGCSADSLQAAVEAQVAAGIMTVVSAGNAGSGCNSVKDPAAIYDASYSVGA